jgi:ADP-dependent NAD(P)H-hydrate dehydratase / NAD(P)H-hydrate epimerase
MDHKRELYPRSFRATLDAFTCPQRLRIVSVFQTVPALPVYRTDEVRRIESLAQSSPAFSDLMERAGLAAAELARELIAGSRKPVLVLAGPGNNGGDAFVVARHLKQWWHSVHLVHTGERTKLSADAVAAFDAWVAAGGATLSEPPHTAPGSLALIVDGLFGIGLERSLSGRYAQLVAATNASGVATLALDIPSGLHADSGRVLGCAVRARHTITFIALKPGLLTLDGPDHCGALHVKDLGLDVVALLPPAGTTIGSATLRAILPARARNSHKGTFGSVGIVGGSTGMSGAALLAARGALKLGSGRVYAGFLAADAPSLDASQPELMLRRAKDVLGMDALSCLVLGPGLSQSVEAIHCVERGLALAAPLVIDADALNLIGAHAHLQDLCIARSAATVLTPHPAEAARLSGRATGEIQSDRVAAALWLANRYRAVIALKGVGTIVATPDGRYAINTSGNPGMASAGMGDVLSGLLAALIAQGVDAPAAARAAVHLHGLAADRRYRELGGPIGMTASEVGDAAREILNAAIYEPPS